jgi:bisphosphoglycerate-dependent phosphoglycerate mutase
MNHECEERNNSQNGSLLGPVIYSRHLESFYNIYRRSIPKNLLECKTEFIDVCLSGKGKKEIDEYLELFKNLKIKYVICCPLIRCLETCELIFKNHPDKDNLTVIVNPWIMGNIGSVDDFSINTAFKQRKFNENSSVKFDWSYFNKLYPTEEDKELYYFNFMDQLVDEEEAKILFEKIKKIDKTVITNFANNDYSEYELLLTEFANYFYKKKKKPESLKNVYRRCVMFKDYIKTFVTQLSMDEKIIIIAHCSYVKIATSKIAHSMDKILKFPPDYKYITNGELLTMDLD